MQPLVRAQLFPRHRRNGVDIPEGSAFAYADTAPSMMVGQLSANQPSQASHHRAEPHLFKILATAH